MRQLLLFIIHGNSQRLKHACRHVTASAGRHRHGSFDCLSQFTRGLGTTRQDRFRDRPSEPVLSIGAKQAYQFVLIDVGEELRRSFALGRIHSHVERRVHPEGEPPTRFVKLMRRDAEVHQHPHHRAVGEKVIILRDDTGQLGEGGCDDTGTIPKTGEATSGLVTRLRVAIDTQHAQRRGCVEEGGGVTAASQGGVDHHSGSHSGKQLDDLPLEHWYVKIVLGHL
jgi:hypothetical protein